MRVLQAASSLSDWGGIERYVLYLAQGLDGQSIENAVACPPGSPLSERMAVAGRLDEALPTPSGRSEQASLVPPKVIPISVRGRINPAAIGTYMRVLRERKYDVVHAHFSPDFLTVGIAARLARTPLRIMTRHVALPMSPAKVRRNLFLFEHIIPVSDAVKKVLQDSGVPPHRMTVAKAGVPSLKATKPRDEVRAALGLKPGDFAVGNFGRLVADKGISVLIDSAPHCKGASFHIFGEGPEKAPLMRSIKEKGLSNIVKLHGFVPEVENLMSAMDAIAIPSVWAEAFPYAALEAFSLGVPVIASNIGGLPELVRDGVNGLLFKPGDVEGFITNVMILMADRTLGPGLGSTGREIHHSRYTVEKMGERIAGVYKQELGFKGYVFELPQGA